MKKRSYNNFLRYFLPVIRILVGLVFFISGLLKVVDLSSYRDIVISLEIFNSQLSFIASIIIPALELILGLLLLLGFYARIVAVHINVLVILYSWVTFYVLNSKPELMCGCFGTFFDLKFSTYHFIFLLVFFIFNLFLIIETSDVWSLQKYLANKISKKKKMLLMEIFTYTVVAVGIILIAFAIYSNLKGLRNTGDSETVVEQEITITETVETSESDEAVVTDKTDIAGSAIEVLSVDEAYQAYMSNDEYVFVDVRTASEYESGHVEGAILMPLSEIGDRLPELPRDKPIIVYCNGSSCNRSGTAAEILINNGFTEVYDLGGTGIIEWIEKGYPHS